MPRPTIRTALLLIAVFAFFAAACREATEGWAFVAFGGTYLSLLVAAVIGLVRRSGAAIGYAVFGLGYCLLLSFKPEMPSMPMEWLIEHAVYPLNKNAVLAPGPQPREPLPPVPPVMPFSAGLGVDDPKARAEERQAQEEYRRQQEQYRKEAAEHERRMLAFISATASRINWSNLHSASLTNSRRIGHTAFALLLGLVGAIIGTGAERGQQLDVRPTS